MNEQFRKTVLERVEAGQRLCSERGHSRLDGVSHLTPIVDGNYLLCQACQKKIFNDAPDFEALWLIAETAIKEKGETFQFDRTIHPEQKALYDSLLLDREYVEETPDGE